MTHIEQLASDYYEAWVKVKDYEVEYEWATQGMDWGTSNTNVRMLYEVRLQELRHICEAAKLRLFASFAETYS